MRAQEDPLEEYLVGEVRARSECAHDCLSLFQICSFNWGRVWPDLILQLEALLADEAISKLVIEGLASAMFNDARIPRAILEANAVPQLISCFFHAEDALKEDLRHILTECSQLVAGSELGLLALVPAQE